MAAKVLAPIPPGEILQEEFMKPAGLSINELAGMIRDVVYPQARIVFDASRPDGPPRKLLDVSRLRNLGWAPSLSLRAGIESTYQWFLRHQADARGLTADLPRTEFRA